MIEEEDFIDHDNNNLDLDPDNNDGNENGAHGNGGHQMDSTDYQQNNVVAVGDGAAAVQDLNTVKGVKNKRIPREKRTTTPYMTKYERARVLGTRALQIR